MTNAAPTGLTGCAPRIENDAERTALLHALQLLDSGPEESFDAVTRLAASFTGRPIALLGLVDTHKTFFKSRVGLDASEAPRDFAFCSYAIAGTELFEVPDARADARFRDNPLVTGAPHVRFYAGMPLVIDGYALGTVCVVDQQAYALTEIERQALRDLGKVTTELLERRLSNRAKSRFISSMSHEMRTPLNAILGFAQLLALEFDEKSKPGRHVKHIVDGGRHLLGLINEVLDFTRLESGVHKIELAPTEVPPLVAAVAEMLGPLARERGIVLRFEAPAGLLANAEAMRVKQVLVNLAGNAIKYSKSGGEVRIVARRAGDMVQIAVADTGEGLSLGQIESLFKPFERLGQERGAIEGTGLGLALSQRLADAMGGDIGVQSAPGCGSVFTLRLRACEVATSAAGALH